jgi:hypothetical protein
LATGLPFGPCSASSGLFVPAGSPLPRKAPIWAYVKPLRAVGRMMLNNVGHAQRRGDTSTGAFGIEASSGVVICWAASCCRQRSDIDALQPRSHMPVQSNPTTAHHSFGYCRVTRQSCSIMSEYSLFLLACCYSGTAPPFRACLTHSAETHRKTTIGSDRR